MTNIEGVRVFNVASVDVGGDDKLLTPGLGARLESVELVADELIALRQ